MSSARARRQGSADLVELIRRAVAAGDGALVEVLLTVLEVVADGAMLQRLTEAMSPATPRARPARGAARVVGARAARVAKPRPGRPPGAPSRGRRP
ncbi:hypothetical protein [Kitasatospora sp. NPDC048538]|uniref:hypothetical protein n=1 Tax=unclassified Kitasatospora TaxID=2633591 RepID=UPI00340B2D6F